jgi:Flp pilus assembly pilin Flp
MKSADVRIRQVFGQSKLKIGIKHSKKERRDVEMLRKMRNLLADERGQDMVEYALLASFISIVAIVAIKLIGPLVSTIYNNVVTALTP